MNRLAFQQALQVAMQHHQAGRLDQAEALYRHVLQFVPDQPDAMHLLGLISHQVGKHEVAIDLIARAIRKNGSDPGFYSNLGLAYQALNRLEEAMACYQRALVLAPDFSMAHCNLGIALQHQGRRDDAVLCYQRAVAITPNLAEVHSNLGSTFNDQGNFDEAIDCFKTSLACNPDNVGALLNLGSALKGQGRTEEVHAYFERALQIQPDLPLAYSNKLFTLNYLPGVTPETLVAAHRGYADRYEAPLKGQWPVHTHGREPARRLKIGYVSPDFRLHSVAYFMEPILAHHDKSQVEVYCYYNHTFQDAVTARLKRYADHWIVSKGLSDAKLAAHVEADGIDILVDLAGHTGENRLQVFARKPAPVQVSYLGYPATTGLTAMDYRLVTADTDPAGTEAWHSERLYRLPRSLWCYRPGTEMPDVTAETPARRNGHITFGGMNNLAKISSATIAAWAAILTRLPTARLVLTRVTDGGARRHLLERFAAHGIGNDRLELLGVLRHREYYLLLNTIDIALDTFPYAGTTTTCESLWMGVPVVSLVGRSSVSRSGYALLKGLGLEELVAQDEGDYVAIATTLVRDLPRLTGLRAGLRPRMVASDLCDEAGFTRDLEAAYRDMWQTWCRCAGQRG